MNGKAAIVMALAMAATVLTAAAKEIALVVHQGLHGKVELCR